MALTSNGADYVDYSFSPNEVLVAGTVRRPLQGNDERLTIRDDSLSSALNLRYEKGPWTIKAEGSYSDAQLNYNQTYVRTQTRASYLTSFDFTGGGVPQLTLPSGVDLLDPSLYNYSNFFDNRFESNAKEYATGSTCAMRSKAACWTPSRSAAVSPSSRPRAIRCSRSLRPRSA
ncbi:hypothetical protein ACFSUK_34810 [Sphingobium scionense]